MKKGLVGATLLGVVIVAGAAIGAVNAPPAGARAGGQSEGRAEQAAQQAVDAVFSQVGGGWPFMDFPRSIGTKQGVVGIGGPSPGTTIPATFETEAVALGGGKGVRRCRANESPQAGAVAHAAADGVPTHRVVRCSTGGQREVAARRAGHR